MNKLIIFLNPLMFFRMISWSVFSLTSFQMLNKLKDQNLSASTVIDVGANIGQFAVAASKLLDTPRIYAFEPFPQSAQAFSKNTQKLPNITLYPIGLGEQEGETEFHVNSHSHSSSILALADSHKQAFPQAQEAEIIKIKVSTLDTVFKDIELQSPVLLKLDVQGYEPFVLRGGQETLKRVDYVILEASFKPLYEGEMLFTEIIALMESYGFRFLRPVGWLEAPKTGEILQADTLFERKKL